MRPPLPVRAAGAGGDLGLGLIAIQIGPLDTLADSVLVAHVIQRIVIGDIASLLIGLGLTGPVIQPFCTSALPARCGRSPTRSSSSRFGP
jgi:hypothetical protein